jgi:hypothetical protein
MENKEFGFLEKIKYLFTNPNLFFKKIKYENGIKNSMLMYCLFLVVP